LGDEETTCLITLIKILGVILFLMKKGITNFDQRSKEIKIIEQKEPAGRTGLREKEHNCRVLKEQYSIIVRNAKAFR